MASVDFKKCKAGTGDVGALLRHCDARERLKHDHGNEHIDKSLTQFNTQGDRSYRQTMSALRDRLAELDARPGANKRKDRVELFMLEVPIPAGHDPQRFAEMAVREISDMYGERNVLNWYLHRDEIHTYMDHGEERTSLCHVHVPVVPEIDGRLCGKDFSSRARMVELNRRIDEGARELGGPAFLTGEHPRKRSVEELKLASYREASEAAERAERERSAAELAACLQDQVAQEAEKRAQEARETAEQGKAYLQRLQGEIEPLERVLERLRSDAPIAERRVYKSLGGEQYIRISPDEARAIDAAVAVQTPLVEAEERAREIVSTAQARVDGLLRKADIEIEHYRTQAERFIADIKRMMAEPVKKQPSRSRTRTDRDTPGGRD